MSSMKETETAGPASVPVELEVRRKGRAFWKSLDELAGTADCMPFSLIT